MSSFCSASDAFGQTFGSKTISGAREAGLSISTFVSLPPRYAPFDGAEVIVSRFSKQINRVKCRGDPAKREGSGPHGRSHPRAVPSRAGWTRGGGRASPSRLVIRWVMMSPTSTASAAASPTRQSDSGSRSTASGKKVDVTCIDLPGFVKHVAEALGPPPVGTEKPAPPFAPGTAPVKLDCTKSGNETELRLMRDDQKLQEWMGRYKAMNDYFEALMEWDGQQFVRSGKWSDKRKKDFELNLLSRPELTDGWAYFLGLATKTLNRLATVLSTANADDSRASPGAERHVRGHVRGGPAHARPCRRHRPHLPGRGGQAGAQAELTYRRLLPVRAKSGRPMPSRINAMPAI